MFYRVSDHPLLPGEITHVDRIRIDLGALILNQPSGLRQILRLGGRVTDVGTDRAAGVDSHDARTRPGQPDAVCAALAAGAAGDIGDPAFQRAVRGHHAETSSSCAAAVRNE